MYVFSLPPLSARPLPFSDAVDTPSLASIFDGLPPDHVPAGQSVAWEGDSADSVIRLTSGVLRQCRLLPDGRRMITRFLFPGDILGLGTREEYPFTAEAVTPVTIARCSRARFEAALEASSRLRREVLDHVVADLETANEHLLLLGRKTAEERVASFLLLVAARKGALPNGPIEINVPMGRQDIADYLGLTLETVCRAMTSFKRHKLIKIWGRRQVWLRNPAALAACAGHMPSVACGL